jgi:putative chitinase
MNRAKFFASVRSSLFGGKLSRAQVEGMERILNECEAQVVKDKGQIAYLMATAYHETAKTMCPIREFGNPSYFRKMYDIRGNRPSVARALGNVAAGDGAKFYGRGFVQITGRRNYTDWGKRLGVNLINSPDLALEPRYAARILVEGSLLGTFTGKKLADYIDGSKRDFVRARRIINGSDKAAMIARYANDFLAALQ